MKKSPFYEAINEVEYISRHLSDFKEPIHSRLKPEDQPNNNKMRYDKRTTFKQQIPILNMSHY